MPHTGLIGNAKSRLTNLVLGLPGVSSSTRPRSYTVPTYAVQIAFGVPTTVTPDYGAALYGTDPAAYGSSAASYALYSTGDWVDVTAYVESISIRRGRQHELDRTQAGTLAVSLKNDDRRFDPSNTASPYYPDVVPMVAIRVQTTVAGTVWPLFYGYVEDWKQVWPVRTLANTGKGQCQLAATDGFAALALFDISSNLYSGTVAKDQPSLYFRLADPLGTGLPANEGSVSSTMRVVGTPTFGGPGPLTGGQTALSLPGNTSTFLEDTTPDASLKTSDAVTVEAWIQIAAYPASATDWADVVTGSDFWGLCVDGTGKIVFRQEAWTSPIPFGLTESVSGATTLAIGTWYHVIGLRDPASTAMRVYVDGVLDGTAHYTRTREDTGNFGGVCFGYNPFGAVLSPAATPTVPFQGTVAQVAVYLSALDALTIATHAAATADSFGAQNVGSAIDTALDGALWPAGQRDLDVGSGLIAHDPASSVLEECLVDAEDTDRGLFFIGANGNATYRSRASLHGLTYVATLDTFGDDVTEVVYSSLELTNDDEDLHNTVTVERSGGVAQVASDSASMTQYGPRSLSITGGLQDSDLEASDLAIASVSKYKDPATRPRQLVLVGGHQDPPLTYQASVELGTRITVRRRPPGGGTPITLDATVEGISHDIVGTDPWVTTWDLVPAEDPFWIIEDGTFGAFDSTTRFGY